MTDQEFELLLNLKKCFLKDSVSLPDNGKNKTFDIKSISTNDTFL